MCVGKLDFYHWFPPCDNDYCSLREAHISSYANISLLVLADVNYVFIHQANWQWGTSVRSESLLKSSCGDLMKKLKWWPFTSARRSCRRLVTCMYLITFGHGPQPLLSISNVIYRHRTSPSDYLIDSKWPVFSSISSLLLLHVTHWAITSNLNRTVINQ